MNKTTSKEKIISAAMKEFSEKGKAGARMDNIAQSAGVNKAMIYYYFSSKDELFREIIREVLLQIMNFHKEILKMDGSIEIKIEKIVRGLIGFMKTRGSEIIRILHHEMMENFHNLESIAKELAPGQSIPVLTGLAPMFSEAIEKGELRGEDAFNISSNILSLCAFQVFSIPLIKIIWNMEEIDEEEFLEMRIRNILDLLHNGIFFNSIDKEGS